MPATEYMILRKTPFQETSLVVAGISPEFGRLDFVFRGVRKTSGKKFPEIELFRELSIEFSPSGRSAFASLKRYEPLRFHDSIALSTECYVSACRYAAFLLRNTRAMVEIPRTFRACSKMLNRMEEEKKAQPWISFAKLVYLHENGMVSVPASKEDRLRDLMDFAEGNVPEPPLFAMENIPRMTAWIDLMAERME